jgi:hypothetical protein
VTPAHHSRRSGSNRIPVNFEDPHYLAAIIIPGQSGTYRYLRSRVTGLLAESGQSRLRSDRESACTVTLPVCIAVKMVDFGDARALRPSVRLL